MKAQQDRETYSKQETARRRDEALKRALNTPPKPHKKKGPAKRDGPQDKRRSDRQPRGG